MPKSRVCVYVDASILILTEAALPDGDFSRLGWKKVHVAEVASLFKLFFREMPDSLLQHELYDCFISVYGMFRIEMFLSIVYFLVLAFQFANDEFG
jgi:hypothetical protein